MTVTTLTQKVHVADVADVIVTDAEVDPETGDFVREIRVIVGDVAAFVLRVSSETRDNINLTAPEQEF